MPGLERNVLTIRDEKKFEEDQKDEKKNHHLIERSYGVFYRMLQLPVNRAGHDVQRRAQDHDPQAPARRGTEDRGQRRCVRRIGLQFLLDLPGALLALRSRGARPYAFSTTTKES